MKRWGAGGLGCEAHLDRCDLRNQRKQARVVRRAELAVVLAGAVGGHVCGVLLLAALVQAVAGAPVGIERLSGRRDLLQTEVCVRACVRACGWVASVMV